MMFLDNLLLISLEAAPWLLLGLLVCGLIKAWMNEAWLAGQLGGSGLGSVLKAALIGTPLPLCSCSVIPVAMGIRRSGASKSSTVSFLVATPETGADSIALSYAMLGPLMAVVRPVAAIVSAVTSGLLVTLFDKEPAKTVKLQSGSLSQSTQGVVQHSCCGEQEPVVEKSATAKSCCSAESTLEKDATPGHMQRLTTGMKFAFTDIFDDFVVWLAIGILFAALVRTFVPDTFLMEWGSGVPAMLVMMAVGIPMYICATASTPIAAALIAAGVSPGTALVFLLAGPATNMATLAVIARELGQRVLVLYLTGMAVASIAAGLALDALLEYWGIDVLSQLSAGDEMVPNWIAYLSLAAILVLSLQTFRRKALV